MDAKKYVGMELGLKIQHQFIISQKVYNGFKFTFKDENIFHVDVKYAQSKGFENKVMYGNILNGFVSFFVGELLPIENVIIQKQEIAFHKPCYLSDIVDFEAELKELYESVNAYVFKFKFNKKGHVVAKGKVQIGLI